MKPALRDIIEANITTEATFALLLGECYRNVQRVNPAHRTQLGAYYAMRTETQWVPMAFATNQLLPGFTAEDDAGRGHFVEHAERAATHSLLQAFSSTEAADMHLCLFAPWFACADCARAVATLAKPQMIVGHADYYEFYNTHGGEKWDDTIISGMKILQKAGIPLRFYRGKLNVPSQTAARDTVSIKVAGQTFTP